MGIRPSGTWIPETETAKNTVVLSELIKAEYSEHGLDLPKLVFIPRSGLEIAGTMYRHLGLGAASVLIAGVERTASSEEDPRQPKFKIGQFPTRKEVVGNHILAVDVVCRSGNTLEFVTNRLAKLGAASVKSAVLYDMTASVKNPSAQPYKPDYYVQDGRSLGYAVFHWERDEEFAEAQIAREDHPASGSGIPE